MIATGIAIIRFVRTLIATETGHANGRKSYRELHCELLFLGFLDAKGREATHEVGTFLPRRPREQIV